jgi:hypothetical protein
VFWVAQPETMMRGGRVVKNDLAQEAD